MSIEAGVVLDSYGRPIYWHEPSDRSGGALPDSRTLWDVLWDKRDEISGFAHSHPGSGLPMPSHTDVTTFAAVEAGLGRSLDWWIVSADDFSVWCWNGPGPEDYIRLDLRVLIQRRKARTAFDDMLLKNSEDPEFARTYVEEKAKIQWMDRLRELSKYFVT